MSTKATKTIDPLAGIPTATAKPVRQPRAKAAAAPATGGTVVNLAQARKKRRMTGAEFKVARDFARKTTGYDSGSPIWGKRLPVVLTDIEQGLVDAESLITAGSLADGLAKLHGALEFNRELQKRVATGQLISAQN